MKKKYMFLAMLLCVVLCFPACQSVKKDPLLGLCLPPVADGWQGHLMVSAREAVAAWGGRSTEIAVQPEPGALLAAVQSMIEQKVDAVVLYALDPVEGGEAAKLLKKKRIPLLLVGNAIEGEDYSALITIDDYAIGQAVATHMADYLKGTGNVLVIEGIQSSASDRMLEGFEQTLLSYPDLHIVANEKAGDQPYVVAQLLTLQLDQQTKIDAIFAQTDTLALACLPPLQETYNDQVRMIVGIGGQKEMIKNILQNHRYCKTTWNYPPSMAYDAVVLATKLWQGEKLPTDKIVQIPVQQIDPLNAAQYYHENASY